MTWTCSDVRVHERCARDRAQSTVPCYTVRVTLLFVLELNSKLDYKLELIDMFLPRSNTFHVELMNRCNWEFIFILIKAALFCEEYEPLYGMTLRDHLPVITKNLLIWDRSAIMRIYLNTRSISMDAIQRHLVTESCNRIDSIQTVV